MFDFLEGLQNDCVQYTHTTQWVKFGRSCKNRSPISCSKNKRVRVLKSTVHSLSLTARWAHVRSVTRRNASISMIIYTRLPHHILPWPTPVAVASWSSSSPGTTRWCYQCCVSAFLSFFCDDFSAFLTTLLLHTKELQQFHAMRRQCVKCEAGPKQQSRATAKMALGGKKRRRPRVGKRNKLGK